MKDPKILFEKTAFECSKLITHRYSTSFTIGIQTLDKSFQAPIYALYGFVRYADEIVDTFHDQDKQRLLDEFRTATHSAINQQISLNPVLHAFQITVNRYKIENELIDAFLTSMKMDLNFKNYNATDYEEYIHGSAEVVGLMCLRVFCNGNQEAYDRLKYSACKLGAAFQKVNFLRDLKSDFEERGRTYFPGMDVNGFDDVVKKEIEKDIERDFQEALIGINQLPKGAYLGVKIAYVYYLKLFHKIRNMSSESMIRKRIRIPNVGKIALLTQTYFRTKMGLT
jgi:phytoene/squalene synthetase